MNIIQKALFSLPGQDTVVSSFLPPFPLSSLHFPQLPFFLPISSIFLPFPLFPLTSSLPLFLLINIYKHENLRTQEVTGCYVPDPLLLL